MKKILLTVCILLILGGVVKADITDELFSTFEKYVEACRDEDMGTFLEIVSMDKIKQRQRKLEQAGGKFSKTNLCSEHNDRAASLAKLTKHDIMNIKSDGAYARLILWNNEKSVRAGDVVYYSQFIYVFFKNENHQWKFLDYEQRGRFAGFDPDPSDKSSFDERNLDNQYQLKRHKFRFLEYDFDIVASVSKEELERILERVRALSTDRIISVKRSIHETDVNEPVVVHSLEYARFKMANPDEEDIKVQVSTRASRSGYEVGFGDVFDFEKVEGQWQFIGLGGIWME